MIENFTFIGSLDVKFAIKFIMQHKSVILSLDAYNEFERYAFRISALII